MSGPADADKHAVTSGLPLAVPGLHCIAAAAVSPARRLA
jgi:hypothetical protein